MSLVTWLICWYLVGVLTLLYMWLDGNDDLTTADIMLAIFMSAFGPLIGIVGYLGSRLPDDFWRIALVRRR